MKEVLQIAYLRHLQDFYLFESVKDGSISVFRKKNKWDRLLLLRFYGTLCLFCGPLFG